MAKSSLKFVSKYFDRRAQATHVYNFFYSSLPSLSRAASDKKDVTGIQQFQINLDSASCSGRAYLQVQIYGSERPYQQALLHSEYWREVES